MKKTNKRLLSIVLCISILIATVVNPFVSEAAEEKELVKYVETTINSTHRGNEKVAPDAPEGYVFAGWYKETNGEKDALNSEEADAAVGDTSTTYYAKYVVESVMYVRWQPSSTITAQSTETNLRLITTVDSLDYSRVGFKISDGVNSAKYGSDTVYQKLKGFVYSSDSSKYYDPIVFSQESEYFMTYSINGVTDFNQKFIVTPMWETIDGTFVEGVQRTFTINDYFTEKNITTGYGFENLSEYDYFTGATTEGNVLNLSPVAYADTSIAVPDRSYGQYGLKGTTSVHQYPKFHIDFNETIGTASFYSIKASVYLAVDEDVAEQAGGCIAKTQTYGYNDSSYQWGHEDGNVETIKFNEWQEVEFMFYLPVNNVELMFNLDGAHSIGTADLTIYIDRVIYGTWPEYVEPHDPNFEEGVTFEHVEDYDMFTGSTDQFNTLSLSEVAYTDTNLTVGENYGKKALKAKNTEEWGTYPTLKIQLDKVYEQGKIMTYSMYFESPSTTEVIPAVEVYGYLNGAETATYRLEGVKLNQWQEITIQFTASHDQLIIKYNLNDDASFWLGSTIKSTNNNIYMDNFIISEEQEPELTYEPNFEEGITFEHVQDYDVFTGSTQEFNTMSLSEVAYTDTNLTVGENYGKKALKGKNMEDWGTFPTFTIQLDKVYEQGKIMTYSMYFESPSTTEVIPAVEVYGYLNGAETATYRLEGVKLNQWQEITIQFTASHDQLIIKYNLNDDASFWLSSTIKSPNNNIYMDNFRITKRVDPSIVATGVTFENVGEDALFTGTNFDVSRVAYSATGLPSAGDGVENYALKLTRTGQNNYPSITFDSSSKTAAFNQCKFRVYIACDEPNTNNVKYVQLNPIGNPDGWTSNSDAIPFNTWTDVSITTFYATATTRLTFELVGTNGTALDVNKDVTIYIDNFVYQ